MRASGAVLFFLGLMMVYIGLFGLTIPAFPLQLTTGFTDEFDDGVIGSQWTKFIWDGESQGGITISESGGAVKIYIPYSLQAGGIQTVESYVLGDGAIMEGEIRTIGNLASGVFAFGPVDWSEEVYRMIYTQDGRLIVRKMFSSIPGDRVDIATTSYTGMNPRATLTGTTITFYNGPTEVTSETYAWTSVNCKFWMWVGSSNSPLYDTGELERFSLQLGSPPQTWTLSTSVNTSAGGSIIRVPDQNVYDDGDTVRCTFYPATDYVFDNWDENGVNVGSANPFNVTMDEDVTLVAYCHYTGNGNEYAELFVKCQEDLDGDEIWNLVSNLRVDILQSNVIVSSIYTDTNGIASKLDLAPGTYTISATHGGLSDSETVTLDVGSNPTVNLYFGTTQPPPEEDGFLEWLRGILDDPFMRELLTFGGIGFVGIGFIVMVAPEGKQRETVSLPPWF